jgi:hypothetical protein
MHITNRSLLPTNFRTLRNYGAPPSRSTVAAGRESLVLPLGSGRHLLLTTPRRLSFQSFKPQAINIEPRSHPGGIFVGSGGTI